MVNIRTFEEICERGRSIARTDFDDLSTRGEIKNPRVKIDPEKKSAILFGFSGKEILWTRVKTVWTRAN